MHKADRVELTDEQKELVQRLIRWYRTGDRQTFSYTGAAGTGKTTVVRYFIEEMGIERYTTCAFVGKAVTVLAKQGLPATTIHSMIYRVIFIDAIDEKTGLPIMVKGKPKKILKFELKQRIEGDPQLLIVDEATMVNDQLCADILSFGIPTIFLGDMNQLPPVFGISSVMLSPDFALHKIMRQAENDPIVFLSQAILKNQPLYYGEYGKTKVVRNFQLGKNYKDFDVILSPVNRTRDVINDHIRHNIRGFKGIDPVIGDKLICRQNDWSRSVEGNIYLTTGMSGFVTDINRSIGSDKYMSIDFHPDISDESFFNLRLDLPYIRSTYDERKEYGISQYEKFEYGYCITVHQSQGSGWDSVCFIDHYFHDMDYLRKVRYTAITRAKMSLTMAENVTFIDGYPKEYDFTAA